MVIECIDKNKFLFSDEGLTSNSAFRLSNLAKEILRENENRISDKYFLSYEVGHYEPLSLVEKMTYMLHDKEWKTEIELLLNECILLKTFCNWIDSAIEIQKEAICCVKNCNFESWCKMSGYPIVPRRQHPTEWRDRVIEYKNWQYNECKRISELKISIPDKLQTIYEKLSNTYVMPRFGT